MLCKAGSEVAYLFAGSGDFKFTVLVVGIIVAVIGLTLVLYHRNDLEKRIANGAAGQELASKELAFEQRKHGRRTAVGRLIVCLGVVMASCYWVHEELAFAIMLGLMLLLILGISILAYVDLASVGLKLSLDQMAKNEREKNQAIDDAIAKHRQIQDDAENRSADP